MGNQYGRSQPVRGLQGTIEIGQDAVSPMQSGDRMAAFELVANVVGPEACRGRKGEQRMADL